MSIDLAVKPSISPLKASWEYLERPAGFKNLAIKPALKALALAGRGEETTQALAVSSLVFSWIDFPVKCMEMSSAFLKLIGSSRCSDVVVDEGRKLVKKGKTVANTATSSVLLAKEKEVLALSRRSVAFINKMGCFCCMMSAAVLLSEIPSICRKYSCEKNFFNQTLLRLISKVSSAVSSIIGAVVFFVGGSALLKTMLFSLSTFSLSISIFKYYFQKL